MQYSQEALQDMAQKINLVEYAGRTLEYQKRNGSNYFAICPFHKEKTPSLAIDEDENYFYCFGCGKHGNIYTWIQLTEGLSFSDAVEKVANLTGTDKDEYLEPESMSVYRQLARMSAPKHEPDTGVRKILDYDRDYVSKYSDILPQEWIDEGIPAEILRKYEIRIDESSNRIVYPVYDAEYRLIGVKGRTRFVNYKDLKLAKYMNYYKIGAVDYFTGMKQVDAEIRRTRSMIIVEGLKSVMKLASWGYTAVAAETSTLSEKQVELIVKMGLREVTIAFDQDVPLSKIRGCTEMLRLYTNVFVVVDKGQLEAKDSPCDKGKDVWDKLYERRVRL